MVGSTDWMIHVYVWGLDSLSDHSGGDRFTVVVTVFERVGYGDSLSVYGDLT